MQIGGGHTFGKSHGAGPDGPGPSPKECPENPYPGTKGCGKGNDTITSGIEGPWTANPTEWDNAYFKYLLEYQWEPHRGPGGAWQWRVKSGNSPKAPMAHGEGEQDVMMMTTDIALATDPKYRKYVKEFANDKKAFADEFARVWYKLVNRDLGPHSRLVGPEVAAPQDWQFPLPDSPKTLADMKKVEKDLQTVLSAENTKDLTNEFVRLARNSAGTYRHTDFLGGANGARIRFAPGKDWKMNKGLEKTLAILKPIKTKYDQGLSWADLIVLAGNVGVKKLGAPDNLPFCPGRTDAKDGEGWEALDYINKEEPKTYDDVLFRNELRGLSEKEYVAMSFVDFHTTESLKDLLQSAEVPDNIYTKVLKYSPQIRHWVNYYIGSGDETYKKDFAKVWTKMMNADRFDGPIHNACPYGKH